MYFLGPGFLSFGIIHLIQRLIDIALFLILYLFTGIAWIIWFHVVRRWLLWLDFTTHPRPRHVNVCGCGRSVPRPTLIRWHGLNKRHWFASHDKGRSGWFLALDFVSMLCFACFAVSESPVALLGPYAAVRCFFCFWGSMGEAGPDRPIRVRSCARTPRFCA